jgi:hypothetical protein
MLFAEQWEYLVRIHVKVLALGRVVLANPACGQRRLVRLRAPLILGGDRALPGNRMLVGVQVEVLAL